MISHRLRQLRQAKGFTLDQLAGMSGVNRGTIHRIELNQVSPRLDTLNLLCQALGTDFQGFFQHPIEPTPAHPAAGAAPRPNEAAASKSPEIGNFRQGIQHWLEHLEALLQASADGLAVTGPTGFILYQSQVSLSLGGDTVRGQQSEPWHHHAHPEDQAALAAGFQAILEQPQEQVRLDYRAPNPEGGWRWLRSTLQNCLDHPSIQGIVINTQDISSWKQSEEQRWRIQKLESQVQVMGAMTSEFSNLWTSVQGLLDAAQVGSESQGALWEMQGTLDRASRLLHQMRDVCGHPRLDLRPLDLNQLVRDQAAGLKGLLGSLTRIELDLGTSLPEVEGDQELLGRLVGYLVDNLVEALDDEAGVLRISTSRATFSAAERKWRFAGSQSDSDGDFVLLEIQESTGCRSQPSQPETLNLVSPAGFPERGLTLPAAFRTVRDHRGEIELQSHAGDNRIRVYLPVAQAAELPPPELPPPEAPVPGVPRAIVLVVEDEEEILQAAVEMLMELGYDALLARNGQEALELYAQAQGAIRLVLLDLNMPVMNGGDTYRKLRAMDPQVRVLLCTGAAATPAHGDWNRGVAGVLRKPYRFEDLRDVVTALLPV